MRSIVLLLICALVMPLHLFSQAPYCMPYLTYGCEAGSGLSYFSLNTIAQDIDCTGEPFSYYHDYSNVSTNLTPGVSYTLTVKCKNWDHYVSVWIDLNNDTTFDDPGELIVNNLFCENYWQAYTAVVTIPPGTPLTACRLRCRAGESIMTDACFKYDNGNAVDYTVVTGPVLITYTPLTNALNSNARTLTATITSTTGIPVSGIGLPVLYWKINDGAWSGVQGVFTGSSKYTFTFGSGTNTGDKVYYYITAQDLSATPFVITRPVAGSYGFSANPPSCSVVPSSPDSYLNVGNYCTPYHNYGCYPGSDNYGLTHFQLNTIDQEIECNITYHNSHPDNYHDYTQVSTTLFPDYPYTVTFTSGISYNHIRVWLDINNNNVFEQPDEILIDDLSCGPDCADSSFSGTLTIPYGTSPGYHRLRYSTNQNGIVTEPCNTLNYGNAADFMVKILQPSPVTITSTPLAISHTLDPRILIATITSPDGIPVSGSGLPVLYWRINSGSYQPVTGIPVGANQYSFTFGGGAADFDTVFYYIVAQDQAVPPNVFARTSYQASGYTTDPPACSNPPSDPHYYTVCLPKCGNYEVGHGRIFPTLTSAIRSLENSGICGHLTLLLTDTAYTSESFPVVINEIPGAGPAATVTIRPAPGVTCKINGSSTTSLIKLYGADYIIIDGSNSGADDRNLTIAMPDLSYSNTALIWVSSLGPGLGATHNSVINCTFLFTHPSFKNLYNYAATAIFAGGTTTNTGGGDNDFLTLENNRFPVSHIGIRVEGTSSGLVDGLTIRGNILGKENDDGYLTTTGIVVTNCNGAEISHNTIRNFIQGYSSDGIKLGTGVINTRVIYNEIGDIILYGKGININTGNLNSNTCIANNLLYNCGTYGYSYYPYAPAGIYLDGTTGGLSILNNTVRLYLEINPQSSYIDNPLCAALAINSSSSAGLDIRNNLFETTVVNATSNGSYNYAIYSKRPASVFQSIDNNNYRVNSTRGAIGYLGSNRVTLANWRTATGQDLHSLDAEPMFSSNNDLHFNNPELDNKGITIPGLEYDIDSLQRTDPPDMGAYEARVLISFTPLPDTNSAGQRTLTATIMSSAGIPVSGIGTPMLYWRINEGTWNSSEGIFLGNDQFAFTFGAGVIAGKDSVSYYIAAQDNSGPSFIAARPARGAGGFSVNPPSCLTPPDSCYAYKIFNPRCGVISIGIGQTFETITEAINDLNYNGVCGPLTLLLTDSSYTSETCPIFVRNIKGTSDTSRVTLKPAPGVRTEISSDSAYGIIRFYETDYFVIDGSNSDSTDRNLTIRNKTIQTSEMNVIWFYNFNSPEEGHNKIMNCNIRGLHTGILSQTCHLEITNNLITGTFCGIKTGSPDGSLTDSVIIQDNVICSGEEDDRIYLVQGIQLGYCNHAIVNQNHISGIRNNLSGYASGIEVSDYTNNSIISNNTIHRVRCLGNLTDNKSFGIKVYTYNTENNITLFNNFIYDIISNGDSAEYYPTRQPVYGIWIASEGVNLWHNTVSLDGEIAIPAVTRTACCFLDLYGYYPGMIDMRNNLFSNTMVNTLNLDSKNYAVYSGSSGSDLFTGLDYNNYFTNGSQGILGYFGGDKTTLAAWQSATGKDQHSLDLDPLFHSGTDPSFAEPGLDNKGILLGNVLSDLRGVTRNDPPDMGAYEMPLFIRYTPLQDTTASSGRILAASISSPDGIPQSGTGLPVAYWKINSGTWNAAQGIYSGDENYLFEIGEGATQGDSVYYFVVARNLTTPPGMSSCPNTGVDGFFFDPPACSVLPYQPDFYRIKNPRCGTFEVGAGKQFQTLTDAIRDLEFNGINCPVILLLTDEEYSSEDFPVVINEIDGACASANITIKPAPGVQSVVEGTSTTSIIKLNGADYIVIDGGDTTGNGRNLTFRNLNDSATNSAVIWIGSLMPGHGATHNRIANCNIQGYSKYSKGRTRGIFAGSAYTMFMESGYGTDNDFLTIRNNHFFDLCDGVVVTGTLAGSNDSIVISENVIGHEDTAHSLSHVGIHLSRCYQAEISGNEIFHFTTGQMIGIRIGEVSFCQINNNIVHHNQYSGDFINGAEYYNYGLYVQNVNNLILSNNLIYQVAGAGIFFWGVSNYSSILNNSVCLVYPTAVPLIFYTDPYGGPSAHNEIRNNIFTNSYNDQSPLGGYSSRYIIQLRFESGALLGVDNNDYFLAGRYHSFIGKVNDDTDTTFAKWKSHLRMDSHSMNIDPGFNSNSDLRFNNHLLNDKGAFLPMVPVDFDSVVRTDPPDMGAYETRIMIEFTALENTNVVSPRILRAKITSSAGIPVSGSGLPVLYWKIDGGSWNSSQAVSEGEDIYSFSFGEGVADKDTVSYFVAAQDMATPARVALRPMTDASGLTTDPPGCSIPPSEPYSYIIHLPVCGTLTVGKGEDFETLTSAVNYLNRFGICGPTVLLLTDSLYEDEECPIMINEIQGSSEVNTVTIRPAPGNSATISELPGAYEVSDGSYFDIIVFHGADHVILDGSNSGGSDRSLTIILHPDDPQHYYPIGDIIRIASLGPGKGATHNQIKNCRIIGFVRDDGEGYLTGIESYKEDNDSLSIVNNRVERVTLGIEGGHGKYLIIADNILGSDEPGRYVSVCGIASSFSQYVQIKRNTIFNLSANNYGSCGISLSGGINSSISENWINNIGSEKYGGTGIAVKTFQPSSDVTIANNLISDIKGRGHQNFSPLGIQLDAQPGTGGVNIWHNTVSMRGDLTYDGATQSAAIMVNPTGMTDLDIRNNILDNSLVNLVNPAARNYAVYSFTLPSGFDSIDYNDYHVVGSQGAVGYLNGFRSGIPEWQMASGQDTNSINADPAFVSDTDLHPTSPVLNNSGIRIGNVTGDFTGADRSNPPDLGAFEYILPVASINTLVAAPIGDTTATLNGNINTNNEIVTMTFEYGPDTGYGSNAEAVPSPLRSIISSAVSANLSGLTPFESYHCRLKGITSGGETVYGNDMTFTPGHKSLTIKAFIEGLYAGNGTLSKVQDASGNHFTGNTADKLTIELHNAANYPTIVHSSGLVDLNTNGTVSIDTLPASLSGSYYLTIRHRNSIATVSSIPLSFATGAISFDFTNSITKAYGSNMIAMGDGNYAFFSGDCNQDGYIDSGDITVVDNDAANFIIGYIETDINGDSVVDTGDFTIIDNNAAAFVQVIAP